MRKLAHYTLPDPIIESAEGTIEDERGRLWVTRKLIGAMQGEIEHLDTIARQLVRAPETLSKDAFVYRAEQLSAMAEAIDERMQNSLQMIDAVLDHWNEKELQAARPA